MMHEIASPTFGRLAMTARWRPGYSYTLPPPSPSLGTLLFNTLGQSGLSLRAAVCYNDCQGRADTEKGDGPRTRQSKRLRQPEGQ